MSVLEQKYSDVEIELYNELYKLPNSISSHTPIGTEQQYKLIDVYNIHEYITNGLSHTEFGHRYDLLDFQSASDTTGSRFVYLKNELALLEQALMQYTIQQLIQYGYTAISTPDLIKTQYIEACGFMPRTTANQKSATQIYNIADTDLSLIGTSEHCIAAIHTNKLLDNTPLKYVASSHCYRTESGSYGAASKGLYRLHQFNKIELFILCTPDDSTNLFDELITIQQQLYNQLNIHYRMIEIASGDLGSSAYRKIDIESYMPYSRHDYGEISSTSNCTDYQARRLNIRYKSNINTNQFVHTLNGTGVAIPRMLITIIEQNQYIHNDQICVRVPDVLQPYMMGIQSIPSSIIKRE